jgi:hypothetical protein
VDFPHGRTTVSFRRPPLLHRGFPSYAVFAFRSRSLVAVTVDGGGSVLIFGRLLRFWVVHCGPLGSLQFRLLQFYNHCVGGFWVSFLLVLVRCLFFPFSCSRSWSLLDQIGVLLVPFKSPPSLLVGSVLFQPPPPPLRWWSWLFVVVLCLFCLCLFCIVLFHCIFSGFIRDWVVAFGFVNPIGSGSIKP